jgi:hypothetical protein
LCMNRGRERRGAGREQGLEHRALADHRPPPFDVADIISSRAA